MRGEKPHIRLRRGLWHVEEKMRGGHTTVKGGRMTALLYCRRRNEAEGRT